MKKLYIIAAAALTASVAMAANGDVTDGWLCVEDFESYTGTPGIWNMYGSTPTGTPAIEVIEKDGDAANHAAKFTGGDYNTMLEFNVTLPDGKTLADYKAIDFDIYNFKMTYKPLYVNINGTVIKSDSGNDIGGSGDEGIWKHFNYDIENAPAENAISIRIGFKCHNEDAFAVDNIRLQEKTTVAPGTYTETQNGTMTGRWLMVQDYQTKVPGDAATLWGRYGSPAGTGEIAEDEKDATNLVAVFTGGDYNTYFSVNVTLPEGKTLKDYKNVAFDLYRFDDDDNYKKMLVQADNEEITENESYTEQSKAGVWTAKVYPVKETTEIGNTFQLRFGISSDKAHYAVDNVRLEERPSSEGPSEYYATTNGTVTEGTLMLQDYQINLPGDAAALWGRYGTPEGTGEIAVDAKDAQNLVAVLTGGDYNTYFAVDVTLPEGKTLKNYKEVAFDIYRFDDDDNYKQMHVWAGDDVILNEEDYTQQAEAGTWTTKVYPISETTEAGNNFQLRFGISSGAAHYAVDNVRLVQRTGTTGIEDVAVSDSDSDAVYYNLGGARMATDNLAPGIYIKKQGGKATKVFVK